MSPTPTGRLIATATGRDLVLSRIVPAPPAELWAWLTEPERTARWFGPWRGQGGAGSTVEVQMVFEEGAPWSEMRVEVCDAPRRLGLRTSDEAGEWHLEAVLTEAGGGTELALIQHLDADADPGTAGPGWEYYLDMLEAARTGTDRPDFDDYFPAQQAYFQRLTAE